MSSLYKVAFADYPLREHERVLAALELRGLLPDARFSEAARGESLEVETAHPQAEDKLRQLTFFSRIRCNGAWLPTMQHELEVADSGRRTARNIRYFAHSLHEYKGRFYPQMGKALMNVASGGKGVVLDPFCGCGTLLLEAAMGGVAAVGVDINPIGCMIARAKIASLRLAERSIEKMHAVFCERHSVILEDPPIGRRDLEYLRRWFPEENLAQILELESKMRAFFSGNAQLFLRTVLSDILKQFSWQAPGEQRIRRRKDIPPCNVREVFRERLVFHLTKIERLRALRKFTPPKAEVKVGDARDLPLPDKSIDCVVTSPPYATALPYIDADRLSLFYFSLVDRKNFSDLERRSIGNREISMQDRRHWEQCIDGLSVGSRLPEEVAVFLAEVRNRNARAKVGFRRKNTAALLCKYFIDMQAAVSEMYRVLKPSGKAALVVGDNFTVAGGVRMEIPTAEFVNLIAENSGFRVAQLIPCLPPAAYNIYSKNASKRETISILEKV